jgi:hypothetical protein
MSRRICQVLGLVSHLAMESQSCSCFLKEYKELIYRIISLYVVVICVGNLIFFFKTCKRDFSPQKGHIPACELVYLYNHYMQERCMLNF